VKPPQPATARHSCLRRCWLHKLQPRTIARRTDDRCSQTQT